MTDPKGAEVRAGEILVAERTDPGWILLFPAAAGVVVERGSVLSHSAIVARELGIPAVVSVAGLTTWLQHGRPDRGRRHVRRRHAPRRGCAAYRVVTEGGEPCPPVAGGLSLAPRPLACTIRATEAACAASRPLLPRYLPSQLQARHWSELCQPAKTGFADAHKRVP